MRSHLQMSENTYIQFSFQKSLRKYEKPPHKKTKLNCKTLNHGCCQHCIDKIHRRNRVASVDRISFLQDSRRLQHNRSKEKIREYSSRQKSSSNSKHPNCYINQIQLTDLDKIKADSSFKNISKFGITDSQNSKTLFQRQGQNQNQISIEKNFQFEPSHKRGEIPNFECEKRTQQKNKIQQEKEQDQSFCHISIESNQKLNKSNKSNSIVEQKIVQTEAQILLPIQIPKPIKQIKQQQKKPYDSLYNPGVSYAYFSSVSSLASIQDNCTDQISLQEEQNKLNGQANKQNKQLVRDNMQMLKLESKQQLKKEHRKQFRERVFYQVKKVKQLNVNAEKCKQLQQNLKDSLGNISTVEIPIQQNKNKQAEPMDEQKSLAQEQKCQNSFKRATPCVEQDQRIVLRRKVRKQTKLEPEQNQFLGRVKLDTLGQESFCLSIRSFSKFIRSKANPDQIVEILIKKRPYLVNSKQQLKVVIGKIIQERRNL